MERLEELAVKFLQNEEYKLKVRKAGVFRFLEEYRFREHRHEEYEINYISSGQGIMCIEGQEIMIPQGQCVVITPFKRHSFRVAARGGCRLTQLEMSLEMKNEEEEFLRRDGEILDYYVIHDCEELIPLIERIARLYRKGETEQNAFLMKISAVETMITLSSYIKRKDARYSGRVRDGMGRAVAYMEEHFCEDIDVEQAARVAGVSSRYLRRYFSEVLGMSCIQYLTKLRLEKARRLLWETDKGILDIALESGYENAQYFTRVFKRNEGVTPREYRMRWREDSRT